MREWYNIAASLIVGLILIGTALFFLFIRSTVPLTIDVPIGEPGWHFHSTSSSPFVFFLKVLLFLISGLVMVGYGVSKARAKLNNKG